jgi:signal transduction histidine kinase
MPALSEKNVLLKEVIPEGSFPLVCDRAKLSEILRTLILTSLEHTNTGGEITVEFIRGREGEISVRISDNGVGLPAELLLNAADRHYRPGFSAPAQESTMGIGGVQDVVGLHGGRLFVTTKAGEGSTFLFSLPAVQKGGEEKSHDEQAVHSGRRRR